MQGASRGNQSVLYARVSSKEQEREGFSIPAQLKLLKEYAKDKGFEIVGEYVDIETAKESGRTRFGEMAAFLKGRPRVRTVLVEKTDRLYRNFTDYVILEELDLEVHLVKEGQVISKDSRSSEKFFHGIKVLMAKNYLDNLSEEAKKGMREKAEEGIWPSYAPFGYRNVPGPNGKKVIEPDPVESLIVRKLFERYVNGQISLDEATEIARADGMVTRKSKAPVGKSAIQKILRNRIYLGEFAWDGKSYKGIHVPIVSRELWEKVQLILDSRFVPGTGRAKKEFAFAGLISCGHCGCALVGQKKKGRYVYYHCSGYRGKCPEPYIREEVLEDWFTGLLMALRFDDQVYAWIRTALVDNFEKEKEFHIKAVKQLEEQSTRLQGRLDTIYVDKIEGKVDLSTYDRLSSQWRAEQAEILRNIESHQAADRSYMDLGVRLVELAQRSLQLFVKQNPYEKRRLLKFLLWNCSWKNGELKAEYRQPFDILAVAASRQEEVIKENGARNGKSEGWWAVVDLNH